MGVSCHSGQWTDGLWAVALTAGHRSPSLTVGQLWFPGSHQIKGTLGDILLGYEMLVDTRFSQALRGRGGRCEPHRRAYFELNGRVTTSPRTTENHLHGASRVLPQDLGRGGGEAASVPLLTSAPMGRELSWKP